MDYCEAIAFQLEAAPDTGYLHYQGYFKLENKNRFEWIQKHIRKFEFLQERKGKVKEAWTYGTKLDTRVSGPWTLGDCPVEDDRKKDTTYQEALAAPTVREGLNIVKTNKPRDFCLYGTTIERNLNAHHQPKFAHKYGPSDFNRQLLIFPKSTVVYGPSETGKTSFILAHFKNPLLVRHIDTLKKLSPDHDGVVFDDMCFTHWPPESVIALVDIDFDSDIHVRYGTVHIPANTRKVFTHNSRDIFYKGDISDEQRKAIDRRVEYFHVTTKLYGKSILMADAIPMDIGCMGIQMDVIDGQ